MRAPGTNLLPALLWVAAGLLILAVPLLVPHQPAPPTTAPNVPQTQQAAEIQADEIPSADSFTVADKRGDNGSSMVVRWNRPAKEPKSAQYIVEVASAPDDFGTRKARSKAIVVQPPEAGQTYETEITPATGRFFPPPAPMPLTPARLKQLVDDKVITAREAARFTNPDESPAGPASAPEAREGPDAKAQIDWLEHLRSFLKQRDLTIQKDVKGKINNSTYYFRLAVERDGQKKYVSQDGRPVVRSAAGVPHWFNANMWNNLIFSLLFCGIVLAFIQIAKRTPNLFIRRIGGLEAVEEAAGRSAEMGKPVFFVHGLGDMSDRATIAAVTILAHVASTTAQHGTKIRVMNNDPIVTAVSQEVVQQAYQQAGRPDAYSPDDVSLVASDQFSYVAAVSGNMVREQPGAIFLQGYFFAESLLLAETGASTGAIQVAGTDQFTQLPFFITTCDYTLIGEELYAASAYLSREPRQLGSLRGQDVGKAFLMITIVVGAALLTIAALCGWDWNWLRDLFKVVQA